MSVCPNSPALIRIKTKSSTAFMAEAMHAHAETFHRFFECWLVEQNSYLQQLVSVANNHREEEEEDAVLRPLVQRVLRHYEHYYQAKSNWERRDAILMFSPTWRSKLEDAFMWIGGWRPTMAIHLLFSKSGIQLEAQFGAQLDELFDVLTTGGLGGMAPSQFRAIDELQKKTIREERAITEKFAKQQEAVADRSMVELSNAVSEMMRNGDGDDDGRVEAVLDSKKDGLEELLHMADDLRLETLKAVIGILTPIQSVYYLIAAAELHLRLHDWGRKRDANTPDNGALAQNLDAGLHVS